ncbi:MAG: type II toxin-antitoxin system RelE/ParE family toxin [Alphaproteobacteria bacterium]|nr:type II toxin-antitoxin system RelE/ParE family toxin [Alphaproteobacteria bacterium]
MYDFIAQDSPANAQRVVTRIHDAILKVIRTFPMIGRTGRVPETRELTVSGLPYIVVYKVEAEREAVIILSVVHGAQSR